jgi:outer membrane protein OmpA-like peptidoglycan-associated protein
MPSPQAGRDWRLFALVLCATGSLAASTPLAADQRLKDLLGRAQQQLDGRAVEDLIGKLEGGKPKPPTPNPAPPAAAPNRLTSPGLGQAVGPPAPAAPPPQTTPPPELAAPGDAADAMPSPATEQREPAAAAVVTQAAPPPQAPAPAAATAPQPASDGSQTASPAPTPPAHAEPAAKPTHSATEPANPEAIAGAADKSQLPSVDLEVTFEFNSADLSPPALPTLALLGRAISDPRLSEASFLIGGHTDAKGRSDYNRQLSQLRAEAVRTFLISSYGIAPRRLVAKGFGETRLKNRRNPQGEENRRVQIVNMSRVAGP